jgi:hypothetical protein
LERRYAPERNYFTPKVDTPASAALDKIIAGGVNTLSTSQRNSWALFLVSLGVRTPETLRIMGPEEWQKAMRIVEATSQRASDATEGGIADES